MSAQIIKQLADAHGGQASLGRMIGAAPALVWQWMQGKRPVSPKYARKLEELFGVSRHDTRPDVFGPAVKAAKAKAA